VQENVISCLSGLRDDEELFDVTLVAGERQIRAHRLILSACSAFFKRLLKLYATPNPLIVMLDVSHCDLMNILDFMYNGEVKVGILRLTWK